MTQEKFQSCSMPKTLHSDLQIVRGISTRILKKIDSKTIDVAKETQDLAWSAYERLSNLIKDDKK